MKIHILFEFKDVSGGGNQFLKALKKYFIKKGVYEEDPIKADVILINSHQVNFLKILTIKFKNKKAIFIHRIDGPMRLYNNFKDKRDSKVNFINNIFANATIFQSEWSRKINYKLGLKKKKNEIVISNAPDSKIFNSEGKIKFSLKRKTKIIATSWSNNWNKGFKDYMWLDNNLDFNKYEMIFVGNLPDNFEFKNIKHVKPLNSFDLAEKLKNSDIFITSSKKDPCSNSLIEAIHCGLPAIALNDGGHPEIIKKGGILYNKIEDVPNLINKIKKNYYFYKKAISINSIDKIGHRYFSFIERILTK